MQNQAQSVSSQVQQLRRQMNEKDWALQDITEACEAEKSAFQKALEATQEHRDAHEQDALRLKSQLMELSLLVEQLKQVLHHHTSCCACHWRVLPLYCVDCGDRRWLNV